MIDMRHLRTGFPFKTKFGDHVLAGCYSSGQPVCFVYGVIPFGVDISVDMEMYAAESIIAIRKVINCNEIYKSDGRVVANGCWVRIDPWPYKDKVKWSINDSSAKTDRIIDTSLAMAEIVSTISFLDDCNVIMPENKLQADVLERLRVSLNDYKSKAPAALQPWVPFALRWEAGSPIAMRTEVD
jgi:hypothetical protein